MFGFTYRTMFICKKNNTLHFMYFVCIRICVHYFDIDGGRFLECWFLVIRACDSACICKTLLRIFRDTFLEVNEDACDFWRNSGPVIWETSFLKEVCVVYRFIVSYRESNSFKQYSSLAISQLWAFCRYHCRPWSDI